ncbi:MULTISPECIES: hypothetical protein [Halocynthiibacter]|uniref:Homeodomain phBC6A51-type domain-containing protein n=1 Tax=Halocynthiibacter halioticoli TaxID=2986804 RepID=A0AAE3J1M8_9RHOB|nr:MULTISPECIES: hypothetical protein [Halocynthiibacter]MCV6826014.1 hypothetical protein [Halocynthiibacter halioticoli]MCW4059015.1 hypothetical protein [Halocynthiibacter sp. SDUM655004]
MASDKNYLNKLPVLVEEEDPRAGNARKYDAELHCQMVRDLGQEGAFPAEWCANIGIHRSTLHRWANQHPEFDEALKQAWSLCQAWWERKNRESIGNPNAKTALIIETLRKRFPYSWGNNSAIDTEEDYRNRPRDITEDGTPKAEELSADEVASMDDDDLKEKIRVLQERLKITRDG